MGDGTKENTRTRNIMVMEQKLGLIETSMKGNSRTGNIMDKEKKLGLIEVSMKENGRMGKNTVKGH